MTDREITIPAMYVGTPDAVLSLETSDNGETGTMTLSVDDQLIARGEGFGAPRIGKSLLEMSDGKLAGVFGAFLAHAIESSEDDARNGWPVLSDEAGDWTDALTLFEEDEQA